MPTDADPARTGTASSPEPMNPAAKQDRRERAGEWLERLGGVSSAVDLRVWLRSHGSGRGDDDGEHHQLGEQHAGEDVEACLLQLVPSPSGLPMPQGRRLVSA